MLVLIAGYAVQRGSICAVAAAQELADRRPQRFLSFFFCAAVALTAMALGALLGLDRFAFYHGSADLWLPVAGGAMFGAGAWLNGRCAFGTIARLGSGEAARLGTIAGFLLGFAAAPRVGLHGPPASFESPLAAIAPGAVLAVAGAAAIVLGLTLRREPTPSGWSPFAAMGVIGLVNGVLLVIAAGWPYTNLLMDLAAAAGMELAWRSALAGIFIAGAVAGALAGGGFEPALGNWRFWLRCLAGGVVMGMGASLVPGGNDTMLLVGLPLLLPSFALAYAAMTLALLALALAGRPRLRRARA